MLDLGAGAGKQAAAMAAIGCNVWAVDKEPITLESNFQRQQIIVEDWVLTPPTVKFDAVLMNNIIQFFPKAWIKAVLVPTLNRMLNSGAVIGVRSFYKEPKPQFEDKMMNYWSKSELVDLWPHAEVLLKDHSSGKRPDMQGRLRKFYNSATILKV